MTDKQTYKDVFSENKPLTPKVSPKRVLIEDNLILSPTKSFEKTPLISRSEKIFKQTDHGFVQPKVLIKTNQALGLLRKGDAFVQEDIYSPLKIHDATVTGLRESLGQSYMNRPSYNQTFGDLTLDPNATSFMIHENSRGENSLINENRTQEKTKVKVPFVTSPRQETQEKGNDKPGIPEWLKESNVQQYPYNFLTALKKKLSAAIEASKSPINVPVKQDTKSQEKYQRLAFVNDRREYENCSFTEVVTESDQQRLLNETPKTKKMERQEVVHSGQKRGKGRRISFCI